MEKNALLIRVQKVKNMELSKESRSGHKEKDFRCIGKERILRKTGLCRRGIPGRPGRIKVKGRLFH
jgi:hypothetical protein